MALDSPFTVGRNLNWETQLPISTSRRESPVFIYMNAKWKLIFGARFSDNWNYYIILKNCGETSCFTPFPLSTYLQSKKTTGNLRCSDLTVRHDFEFLYYEKANILNEKMLIPASSYESYKNVTVICVFRPSTDLFLYMKIEKEDKETDNPENDLISDNDGNNLPVALTNCLPSDEASADIEEKSHFQSMSEDIGFMFDKDFITDVKIICGDVVISAHKIILAARSKYFAVMFQNENYKSKSILDNLTIKSSILRIFIRYLYMGEIKDLSEDNALDLYSTSYDYDVNALHNECSHFLAKNLNPENYLDILALAGKYNDECLKDAVGGFVSDHNSLLATDSWINFSKHSPEVANDIYRIYIENTLSRNVQI